MIEHASAESQAVSMPRSATARAVNEALQRFLASPSVSNKVAAVVALQALFAEIDPSSRCEAGPS